MMEFEYYPHESWKDILPATEVDSIESIDTGLNLELVYFHNKKEFYRRLRWFVQKDDVERIKKCITIIYNNFDYPPYDVMLRWAWDHKTIDAFMFSLDGYFFRPARGLSAINIHLSDSKNFTKLFPFVSCLTNLKGDKITISKYLSWDTTAAVRRGLQRYGAERDFVSLA